MFFTLLKTVKKYEWMILMCSLSVLVVCLLAILNFLLVGLTWCPVIPSFSLLTSVYASFDAILMLCIFVASSDAHLDFADAMALLTFFLAVIQSSFAYAVGSDG